MRRWIVLFILIVLLLALVALQRAASQWRYVVTGEPGALLYLAAFDGFTDEWQTFGGRVSAQIDAGELRIEMEDPAKYAWSLAKPTFADFVLRVDARAVVGPLNNGYGVMFRVRDSANYYLFLVSSDGYYQVVRSVDGVQRELSNWIPSPAVRAGLDAVNTLEVTARGDTFAFYINGEPVALCIPNDPQGRSTYVDDLGCIGGSMQPTLTDAAHPVGQIGVVAQTLDEAGVVAAFDHVLVFAP